MNILILNVNKGWAGTESHSITLAAALRSNGNKVVIGCLADGHVRKEAEKAGIPVRSIRLKSTADKFTASFGILKAAVEEKAEVIISNHGKELLPLAVAGKVLGLKLVFFMHGMGKISWLKGHLLSKYFDSVVAVSASVRSFLVRNGLPESKVGVIHNGIDVGRFDPENVDGDEVKAELGIAGDEKVIGTVARLCPEKGLFELMHAFELLAGKYPVRLLVVGDGPSRSELQALATKKSIAGKVIFEGLRHDVDRMYSAMDVFVLPAVWEEPFGLVVIEAMAMQRPVVATEVGGIPEIIEHGRNGILVPPRDVHALASAVGELIENGETARGIALEGFRTAREKFSSQAMAGNLERLLASL